MWDLEHGMLGVISKAGHSTFLYGNGNTNHNYGTGILVHHRIRLAAKRIKFISDRMLYIILRGH